MTELPLWHWPLASQQPVEHVKELQGRTGGVQATTDRPTAQKNSLSEFTREAPKKSDFVRQTPEMAQNRKSGAL